MPGTPHHLSGLCLLGLFAARLLAQAPDPDLLREFVGRATEAKAARDHYTYRQAVLFQELDSRGAQVGSYRELRDVIFSPDGERTEALVGKPFLDLKRLKLTDEDFRDIREINPFVLTRDDLFFYDIRFQGNETLSGSAGCLVFRAKPRQLLEGQRLFDGLIWVSEKDRQIVQVAGEPVPQIHRLNGENLFPRFTTIYRPIDGKFWFPVETLADDTLFFRSGPQRVRITIRYENYKRFSSESKIEYQK